MIHKFFRIPFYRIRIRIFYLQTPSNSGELEFYNRYNITDVLALTPSKGSVFIFDGKQPHSTTPNLSKFPKICIAFNLKKIE